MLVSDFDYPLPEDLIAQQPLADRAASRMLHLDRGAGGGGAALRDRAFRDLPELLWPSDLLVVNNSRVFAARLYGRRAGASAQPISPRNPAAKDFLQGRIEVLLIQPLPPPPEQLTKRQSDPRPLLWQALVRPGRKINVGERLYFGDQLQAEVVARGQFGERTLQFSPQRNDEDEAAALDFFALLESLGHTPLPPYISRPDSIADRERYQTVYARHPGSVAAPTAGLHFTPEILAGLRSRGIEIAEITLHVGLGTFQPVRVAEVEAHPMHRERFSISPAAALQINRARADNRRIVAVGTTTVRTLEFFAAQNPAGEIAAGDGEADLFIFPGYKFRVAGALLTNFHLPQSTLLMLVCAFAGRDFVLAAYHHAVHQRYRFFSYGDCMFIE